MYKLTVSRIYNLFENYESNKYRLWEFLRSTGPIDIAALLFILHETKKVKLSNLTE
jgi:hypothetical protein